MIINKLLLVDLSMLNKRQTLFGGLFAAVSANAVDQALLSDLSALTAHLQSREKAQGVLESRDGNGYTLLHHAALNGCVGALNILLTNGGKIDRLINASCMTTE